MPGISRPHLVLLRSFAAALLVAVGTATQALFLQPVGFHHPFLIYYGAVALSAMYLQLEGGLTATILAALAADYFWMGPSHSLLIRSPNDQIYVTVFVLEGLIISYAADWMRRAKTAEAQASLAEEREKAAEKLLQSEQRLRLALEGAQMGMWEWDLEAGLSEWNEQEYVLLGLPVGDGHEPADSFFTRIHPEDIDRVMNLAHGAIEQGKDIMDEFRIIRPDGEMRWLAGRGRVSRDADGKPVKIFGVTYDITCQRLIEEELRRSEAEARARADELAVLMDTVPAITFIAHDPECSNMSGSRKSRQFLRVPEGKSVSVSAPEEERPTSFRCFRNGRELTTEELPLQMAAKGQVIHDCELTIVFEDGTFCDIFGDAVPLYGHEGNVRGAIGAFLDITELKKIRQELEKAHDELEKRVEERTAELQDALESLKKETEERIQTLHALRERDQLLIHQSRLAAMGEMINNIAHQWRQPLNVLGLIVQELLVIYRKGEFNEEYLKAQMSKSMELIFHMSQTIEDFRSFFRPSVQKMAFKADEMIGKTLSLVEDIFKNSEITVQVEEIGEPVIYGYVSECSQVLLNLLLNARDAFLERKEEKARVIRVRTFCEDGRTVLTIADNAGGIPEEIIDKIFEPYFTTKGPDKGTGIGLFMAKNIIEKHMNGKFTVRNVEGGAEFRIEVASTVSPGIGVA